MPRMKRPEALKGKTPAMRKMNKGSKAKARTAKKGIAKVGQTNAIHNSKPDLASVIEKLANEKKK